MSKKKKEFRYDENYDYDINDVDSDKEKKQKDRHEKTASDGEKKQRDPSSLGVQITTAVLFVVAVFLLLCLIFSVSGNGQVVGTAGVFIGKFLLGFFGGTAVLIPVIIAVAAVRFKQDYQNGRIIWGAVFSMLTLILISVVVHTFFCIFGQTSEMVVAGGDGQFFDGYAFFDGIGKLYSSGQMFVGGGAAGGTVLFFGFHKLTITRKCLLVKVFFFDKQILVVQIVAIIFESINFNIHR